MFPVIARSLASPPRPLGFRFKSYDLAILGAGPGGYVAAIRAAQNGLSTVCVEETQVGGTCLNVGCIPSKTLLNQTWKIHEARTIGQFGISIPGDISWDWKVIQNNKSKTSTGLAKGILGLFKKNKVEYRNMRGRLASPNSIEPADGKGETVEAKHIILATGSLPGPLPGVPVKPDEKRIVTSTGALSLSEVPKNLIIIGGGAIGLEFASIYSRIGSKVTVVEFLDQVANGFDKDVGQVLMKGLNKLGVKFHLSSKVTAVERKGDSVEVTFESRAGGQPPVKLTGDVCLISTGRVPNSKGMGFEEVGVKMDKVGRVTVNEKLTTSVPSIKAIGDLIPGPMLAHKAEEDACAAVADLVGTSFHLDYTHVPAVIYTHPEAAIVGASEAKLKADKVPFRKGMFPFLANSRARCNAENEGFVKILSDPESGLLLGATIVGNDAGDLIQELVLAMANKIPVTAVAHTVHPHPCMSEAIKEACMMAAGMGAIHF
eukprot:Gregarina_sp_Pseudo_9__376@NODE_1244_length_1746_cov_103_652607_g1170_i0_p1_GENE_NODE_1244_length_1746_cov_103_652607_g1170_i0NODE_1244_length_1746_cov_103_652607_g1170_i0_p1_ORF_typecomplete_len488_score132_81Pyr_redox_2/PF07992_14/7_5e58Pyr_redox_dim/PF02852_22/5_9e33Pyr_redox/PF00070_27/3_3Pyr_redox/PF00070_27/6_9e23Pyr_redox_3/PF13738_6/0_0001Pyr_redox_3/PF13738_6/5_4e06Pyr_redox_3/PF13738_6/0_49GIDA/PF01134_22/5_9e09GIDA/PF01134_22/0_054HI0933_like/PF03486_14/0_00023HI0933_like/PF03486_14/2